MKNLDNWILVVIAIASVISPIITAIINNIYQLRLKKIELKQQQYNRDVQRIINILEHYCETVCCVLIRNSVKSEPLSEYSNSYGIAVLYLDNNDVQTANKINELIYQQNYSEANKIIYEHVLSIRKTIDMLRKQRL
ncbi:MAG: hypothetical protein DBY26_06775 [Amedibacillus dolichus]|nr:MAG: hypothetical protein DBY26_06775 [Amedibacillus dolichus]